MTPPTPTPADPMPPLPLRGKLLFHYCVQSPEGRASLDVQAVLSTDRLALGGWDLGPGSRVSSLREKGKRCGKVSHRGDRRVSTTPANSFFKLNKERFINAYRFRLG